jgi:hypothetical protein
MELTPNDLVKARNNSEHEVDVVGTKFKPFEMKVVTFPWMMNHFGDPRSILDQYQVIRMPNGVTTGVAARQVEVGRVQRMWNIGSGPGLRVWEDIPKIEFSTMDDERIFTAYDDPTGSHATAASTTVNDAAAQQEKIRTLERQVAQLLEISGLDDDALPVDDSANIPVDESTPDEHTTSPWAGAEPIDLTTE